MKKIVFGLFFLISISAFAKIESRKLVDHNDGTVTVYPIKSISLKYKDGCGYSRERLIFNLKVQANKNKICRKLGFDSYVPDSLVITNRANLFLETFIEDTLTPCMGQRMYESKGIKSIDCYKEEQN